MNRRNKSVKNNKSKRQTRLKTVYAVIFIVLFWYLLIGNELITNIIDDERSYIEIEKPYLCPCTEANLAKIISLDLGMEDEEDIQTNWYSKDYKYIEDKGIVSLKEEEGNKLINVEKLQIVLEEVVKVNVNKESQESSKEEFESEMNNNIELNIDKSKDYISINEVIRIYIDMVENNSLEYKSLTILETPATNNQESWRVLTSEGEYGFKGLIVDPVINKTIQVAVKGDEILGIMSVQKDESVLDNCIVREVKTGKLSIEMGELKAEINTPNIYEKNEKISSEIEIGKEGRLVISKDGFISYINNEELKGSIKDINSANTDNAEGENNNFLVSEQDVRVVLTNTNKDYEHNNVKMISTEDYSIVYNGESTVLEALTVWNADEFDWNDEVDKISIIPTNESSNEMKLLTVEKSQGFPKYKGVIEVKKVGNSYQIVNEVGIEEYVANVIPSEMPVSYGLEALKVQAVSARTYAAASINGEKYAKYDADLDDTTSSQVYNNQLPSELAYEATSETKGQVVKYKDSLLSSKFFATSCGYTANSGDVWARGSEFPSYTPPYLSSVKQYDDKITEFDMTKEDDAERFFKLTAEDVNSFDENSAWFRWNVELSRQGLSNRINNVINQITTRYPQLVSVKNGEEWTYKVINTVGEVRDIKVIKRGEGGIIMTLEIDGDENSIRVDTEYLIRYIISGGQDIGISVTRMNGEQSGNMSLLPSAFFSPEITYDQNSNLESVVIYGGGFGHGVGMSQDGVLGMIEDGYDYKEILEHYYQGVSIE